MSVHVGFTFWYISLPFPAKQKTSNDQIIGFVEDVNARQLIFLSAVYLNLKLPLYEFSSWTIQSHSTN